MNKLWKVYFWFISVLAVSAVFELFSTVKVLNLHSILGIVSLTFMVLSLYSYIYNKYFFPSTLWAWYFYLSVTSDIFDFLAGYTFLNAYLGFEWPEILQSQVGLGIEISLIDYILSTAVSVPFYIAIYRLSKNKFLKE